MQQDKKAEAQFVRDIKFLYNVARDFSNKLRTNRWLMGDHAHATEVVNDHTTIPDIEMFREHVIDAAFEILKFEKWSREKLARIISLGASDRPGEEHLLSFEQEKAIHQAIGRSSWIIDARRTAVRRFDNVPKHMNGWNYYSSGPWGCFNGMERLCYQAALVVTAAIYDLMFNRYLEEKNSKKRSAD